MRESDPIEVLSQKLRRSGLPGGYVFRTMRELAEHRDDLRREATEQGMSGVDMEDFASRRLGDLDEIAARLAGNLRRASWYGRHPIMSFCFLPLFAFVAAFLFAVWVAGSMGELAGWWRPQGSLDADGWAGVALALFLFRWSLFTAIPFWFCWLARNSYCGHKWAFATCLGFSLHGLFHSMSFVAPIGGSHGSLAWGYGTRLDPAGFLIPLVVFALYRIVCRHLDARETAQEKART
jgi:hypothetical protein